MKTNFSKQLVKPQIKTIEDIDKTINFLYGHIQSLTDAINQIVAGGLSLDRFEKNLPLNLIKTTVTSGNSIIIPGYGASVVFVSDRAIIEKIAYTTLNDNSLEITILFDDDKSHDVIFLVVNERLP